MGMIIRSTKQTANPKMIGRRVQEELFGKVGCRFHLRVYSSSLSWKLMITEGNKQKRQSQMTLPFSPLKFYIDLFLK